MLFCVTEIFKVEMRFCWEMHVAHYLDDPNAKKGDNWLDYLQRFAKELEEGNWKMETRYQKNVKLGLSPAH